MDDAKPLLNFPTTFCCNCGDTDCRAELQDTRVTRYHGVAGVQTTFELPVPVCAACIKSTRRRPSGLFTRLLVWALTCGAVVLSLLWLGKNVALPSWAAGHLFGIAAGLSLILVVLFYRLRRPRPPQTSYYQPVRIKDARLRFGDTAAGQIGFMKLAFTNPDYLNVFTTANRDAINAKILSVVKA